MKSNFLEFNNAEITQVALHFVGNAYNGEQFLRAENELDISNEYLRLSLLKIASRILNEIQYYSFAELQQNRINNSVRAIFDGEDLVEHSGEIAAHLYNAGNHQNIKAGDFFALRFEGVKYQKEDIEAVAFIKCENRKPFIKLDINDPDYIPNIIHGIDVDKLDKGFLVLNTAEDKGYKLLQLDNTARAKEAIFWMKDFLNITPFQDEFLFTSELINVTKDFVTKKVLDDFELSKPEQMEMLDKAQKYFEKEPVFEEEKFEAHIFENGVMRDKYREFKNEQIETEHYLPPNFPINNQAVATFSKVFKSVIKLDKNFHIYVHGNRHLIERGFDEERGKHYYKCFFDDEN